MKKENFIGYYRVFKNDTAVTKVPANDFKPVITKHFKNGFLMGSPVPLSYSLPVGGAMYYGYSNKRQAMEMAKAGALKYIDQLIDQGDTSTNDLIQYRIAHYDDLNTTLLDSNIRREEKNK